MRGIYRSAPTSIVLRTISLAIFALALLGVNRLTADDWRTHSGVTFETLPPESPLAKAGIEAGDVLVEWRRLPSPPANPEEAHGEIHSVFDWTWMAMEQAPRGTVELVGLRGGKRKIFVVARGPWSADEWPWMPKESLDAFLQNRNNYLRHSRENEVETWWEQQAAHQKDWQLRSWLWARLGKMRAARGAWEEAYDAYYSAIANAEEPFAESVLWWELGQLRQRHSDLDLARQAYFTAQALRELGGERESLGVANALAALGALAWEQGKLDQADDLLQQALRIRECLAPGSLWVAESLNDLGLVAMDRRQLDRAANYLQRSVELLQEVIPDSLALANSLNNLGLLAANRRDYDTSYSFLQRAMEIKRARAPESLDFAQGLNNLATVAAARGDLSQAADYYRRSLEIRQRLVPGGLALANPLSSLGNINLARGDLDLAMDYQQHSLEIRQKLAPDSLQVAESLYTMGLIEERRGEHQRAMDLHERALSLRQRLAPDSLDVASSLNSLAVLAEKRGNLKQAMEFQQRSLALRQKRAPESLEVARSLNNLGHTTMLVGQLERAEQLHSRALEIQSRLAPEGLDSALSLSYLGEIASRRGDWKQAIYFHQRALKIQQELAPGTTSMASALHDLAAAHLRSNPHSLALAADLFRRALDTLELQISRFGSTQDIRARFRTQYRDFYWDAMEAQLELGQRATAFHTLERSRARSFLDQLAERDIIFTTDISEDLDRERRRIAFRIDHAQEELRGLNQRDNQKQIEELQEQLRHLRYEADDIEERVRRTSPNLAALQYPQPLDLEATRAALDPGTLLLSYSVGEKEVLLFSLSKREDLRVDTVAISAQELRDRIRYLLSGIASKSKGQPGQQRSYNFEAQARRLDILLIEPVSDRITASERLLILPDGPLHLLPWGALIRQTSNSTDNKSRTWQYLSEWKSISTTLSATFFAERKKYRRQFHQANPPSLAAFGDPLFPQMPARNSATGYNQDVRIRSVVERGFNYERLPASRTEVQQIASLFPQVTTYLGPEATEENVKVLPRNTRIVHFATHATLDERSPLDSAVVLAIPEKFEEGKENGLLQAWEIFEQVRLDADLVVLSACESGLGKEMGGEGLIGLTRAFQYAGARSVMASLWKISDRTTAELMVRFYKHLKEGLPKDEALQAAQMELIRGPIQVKNEKGEVEEIDASAPYYWAAFQIYGDWQ